MDKIEGSKKAGIYLPFIVSAAIILADQITKAIIVARIPENAIGSRLLNDFLWIVHTKNLGIAFSLGDTLSRALRVALFIVVPLAAIVLAVAYCLRTDKLTPFQRYVIGAVVGGGLGNLIDRIFRPEGVVDFISLSLYGFLGMDRFPTFNIADASISIGAVLLALSSFFPAKEPESEKSD